MEIQSLVARTLIVEDDDWQLRGIKDGLDNISSDEKRKLGISHFQSDEACSVADAKQLLADAADDPYDLLLLDLNLPFNPGDHEESPDNGFEILEFVRKNNAARESIIISQFDDYKNVTRTFRGGALDFITKPFLRDNLQTRVLECWKRVLSRQSEQILDQRIRDLIPHDGKGLAHQFSACFSRFIQEITCESESMENEFNERLGLDLKREPQDSLMRHLSAMTEAVRNARSQWTELYASLSGEYDERPNPVDLHSLFRKIKTELLPCLKVKGVELEYSGDEKTEILSFQDDVRVVIKEIILGALSELPDYGDPSQRIEALITTGKDHARVSFNSSLFKIDSSVAAKIEKGERVAGDNLGQVWGLSVAQSIALRGGGKLQIISEPASEGITYLIPLVRYV